MLNELPASLIEASAKLLATVQEDEVSEDAISQMAIPGEDESEEELSGEKEEVIINPEYKTFRTRLPM
jgi:hypothetical protein